MDERIDVGVSGPAFGKPVVGEERSASTSERASERYGRAARSRLMKNADRRKGYLASEIENFAGTLDNVAGNLDERGLGSQSRYASSAASAVRSVSRTLREKSSEDLAYAARRQFEARPGVFLAGLFALGFLGARFLKS